MDFVRFSFSHWMALSSFIACGVCILLFLRKLPVLTRRWVIGSMCSVSFLFSLITRIQLVGWENWHYYIPLHFCSFVEVLCILACITQRKFLYAFVYFCGITACLQGLITPALEQDAPHPVFFAFFLSHSFLVICALSMPLCLSWKSQARDYLKVQLVACIYVACTIPINYILDTNYCFTRTLPLSGSVLDFLGAWPYYLLIVQVPVCLLFYLLSLPVRDKKSDINKRSMTHDGSTT